MKNDFAQPPPLTDAHGSKARHADLPTNRGCREFHIVVSDWCTCFTIKGLAGEAQKQFSSLFEAARHARAISGSAEGFVVISDESGKAVNRIPF